MGIQFFSLVCKHLKNWELTHTGFTDYNLKTMETDLEDLENS